MEVIKNGSVPEEDATNAPIFYGGKVTRQSVVGAGKSNDYTWSLVNFYNGAKNKFHTHTGDQILFVTNGKGYVATEAEQIEITEGDTAFIPAGEKHWHGAVDGEDFSHVSLTRPDSETTVYD